jgi:nucleotide-binding universal stress UspA family protein
MIAPHILLVPTDLSDHSLVALKYAEEIAEIFDAKVIVLSVIEHDGPESRRSVHPEDVLRKDELHRKLLSLMLDRKISHDKVAIVIRHGAASSMIVEAARELKADLVVMSTHGRTGLRHIMMGSVAETVVRHAPCPVLTMKPEEFREIVAISEDDVAGSLHLRG